MDYSRSSNIKCVDSIIKCINFKSIHCTINLYVILLFMVFSEFDYMFILIYC